MGRKIIVAMFGQSNVIYDTTFQGTLEIFCRMKMKYLYQPKYHGANSVHGKQMKANFLFVWNRQHKLQVLKDLLTPFFDGHIFSYQISVVFHDWSIFCGLVGSKWRS